MAKDFNIARPGSLCTACQRPIEPGQEIVATVRDDSDELVRRDFCTGCWSNELAQDPNVVGVWRTRIPQPPEKKKLLVDDSILVNLCERLAGTDAPAKINFRYVLALVLWRKKLLVYDRMQKLNDGSEVWKMHFKGSDQVHEVIDPKMDDLKIAEVSGQLSQIMEGDL